MAAGDLATALGRARKVLSQRPQAGLHDDAPGLARWGGGTRAVVRHLNGYSMPTDMPLELGGTGDQVSPGWMVRAGHAACVVTAIAMTAAREGIELDVLEADVTSRSDMRGLLCMSDPGGEQVYAGPRDLNVRVRISAQGAPAARLRELVVTAVRSSPMQRALEDPQAVGLVVEIG